MVSFQKTPCVPYQVKKNFVNTSVARGSHVKTVVVLDFFSGILNEVMYILF